MVMPVRVICPYCGECFDTGVDTSAGSQEYTEDCQVCCQPILFRTKIGPDGNLLGIETRREND